MSNCPDRDRLEQYAFDFMDKQSREDVRQHVESCASCAKAVEALNADAQALGGAARTITEKPLRRPLRFSRVASIAAAILVAVGFLMLFSRQQEPQATRGGTYILAGAEEEKVPDLKLLSRETGDWGSSQYFAKSKQSVPMAAAPALEGNDEEGGELAETELRVVALDGLDVFRYAKKRPGLPQAPDDLPGATQGTLRAQNAEGKTVGEFPLRHTEVLADAAGSMARTIVQQEYTNSFSEVIEAVYVFPLPSMAAINEFVMEVGGRKIVGIVRPREEAERIYREARARGQTASLLTQERPNIFTQNVANIEPGGTVKIRITYFEQLNYDRGFYEYVFPMVVGPRYIPGTPAGTGSDVGGGGTVPPTTQVPDAEKITPPVAPPGTRSGHDITLSLRLDAGLPITDMKSIAHDLVVTDHDRARRTITLGNKNEIPNRDFILRWKVADAQLQFGVLAHRSKAGGFFSLMMQPPLAPRDADVTPREITFIMDVSGSMEGLPISMSKEVVSRTLDRLRKEDIFNIVFFASGNGQLWERPQANTPENVAAARRFLEEVEGSGGTEMLPGLRRALSATHDAKFLQMYVFLTDGFVGNEDQIVRVVREERGAARFFAFGIGSSVNRFLIDGIGKHGGGESQVVLPRESEHAAKAVTRFFDAIDSPVLVDVAMDWNGLPVEDVYPKKIRDLFAGQAISLVGRFTRKAEGTAFVTGRIGGRKVHFPVKVSLPEAEQEHAALAPVWARHRIADLSDEMLTAGEDRKKQLVKEITSVAVDFQLVSQFTAFVAVDESRIVGTGAPLRVIQPVEMPEGVSYEGVFGEKGVGGVVFVAAWGVRLQATASGKVAVAEVDKGGPAGRAGIAPGAVIKSVNRTVVASVPHLEGLLLQTAGATVKLGLGDGREVELPRP